MAIINFRKLWTVEVRHAFHGGACDALAFIVPPQTERMLAGMHGIARQREGRLHVLIETDEAGTPLSAPVGARLLFGLKPREPSFDLISAPLDLPRGAAAQWDNRADADLLAGPHGVQLSAEQLRITPRQAARPLTLRVFDAAGQQRAEALLQAGDESWTSPTLFTPGEWRIEEQAAGPPQSWALRVAPELLGAWGLLEPTVAADHLATGQDFTLEFAARSDTLRYYLVASRFAEAEFAQLQVLDTGFAAEARPQIAFNRLLPAAFNASHLAPALLDPAGGARIALFEAQAAVARRARGPTGLALQRNGDLLVGHLPLPRPDQADAQFVVHLSQP